MATMNSHTTITAAPYRRLQRAHEVSVDRLLVGVGERKGGLTGIAYRLDRSAGCLRSRPRSLSVLWVYLSSTSVSDEPGIVMPTLTTLVATLMRNGLAMPLGTTRRVSLCRTPGDESNELTIA
jgi:hypothetical protein